MDNLLSPAVELQPPDISAWRRGSGPDGSGPDGSGPDGTGIDYVHNFDAGSPGPTVMVTAVVHRFVFLEPFRGLDVVPKAGSAIALDGGRQVVTPYDDCVLVMPVARPRAGTTAVRLGRVCR